MKRALLLMALAGMGGCASERGGVSTPADGRPAAIVNGREVPWDRLRPAMSELAGGQVLEDVVLEEMLERACAERGITVGPEQIAAERALLVESLDVSPDRAEELLRTVRASRKMGEVRFAGALRRSAMLRALVGEDSAEQAGELAMAIRVRQSERSVVRIIATANEAEAAVALARVTEGRGGVVDPMRFATVAAEVSLDESAARGGVYGEISAVDSGQSAALRRAVAQTAVGHVTPVVSTGEVFVIALVEKRLPARAELTGDERVALAREVRVRWQRREMELRARQLLGEAKVVPMDRSLGWSWDVRGK